jgi:pyruvate dehydrogenase E2 component (dihydrolipoamide acetyltransferase)
MAGESSGFEVLPWPQVDYGSFGPIEVRPLPRIAQFAAGLLTRNAVMIPHVTHHEEVDITELEE